MVDDSALPTVVSTGSATYSAPCCFPPINSTATESNKVSIQSTHEEAAIMTHIHTPGYARVGTLTEVGAPLRNRKHRLAFVQPACGSLNDQPSLYSFRTFPVGVCVCMNQHILTESAPLMGVTELQRNTVDNTEHKNLSRPCQVNELSFFVILCLFLKC